MTNPVERLLASWTMSPNVWTSECIFYIYSRAFRFHSRPPELPHPLLAFLPSKTPLGSQGPLQMLDEPSWFLTTSPGSQGPSSVPDDKFRFLPPPLALLLALLVLNDLS